MSQRELRPPAAVLRHITSDLPSPLTSLPFGNDACTVWLNGADVVAAN
jgi:hypothetical protein